MSQDLTNYPQPDTKIKNLYFMKGDGEMSIFPEGRKVIIIGDRDGIPGPAIEECVATTPAEVVFSATECFV